MTDRPILFSAPMVRALLDGTKTQTRRVLRKQPHTDLDAWHLPEISGPDWVQEHRFAEGFDAARVGYEIGYRLWVRETWTARMTHGWTIADARSRQFQEEILYAADGDTSIDGWWPSIHMPREFSRLTLTVTEVRVERLQDISEADASAEGISPLSSGRYHCGHDEEGEITCKSPVTAFAWLWNGINGKRPGCHWQDNPWVVATTFEVIVQNIDQVSA